MIAAEKQMPLIDRLPVVKGDYIENVSLANLTWFRTGGPAEVLFRPENEQDLIQFMSAIDNSIPVKIIGVGSNILVRDKGLEGVVIKLGKPFSTITIDGNLVTAQAGAMGVSVANKAAIASLSGLEFLRGIPGTIGGALRMNAGAYGSEVADVFICATAVDREGNVHTLRAQDMGFSYRHIEVPEGWMFLSGTFQGVPGDKNAIQKKMDEIQKSREETQPMRVRTGGSTFKNPQGLKAWQLIENAGCRGLEIGGAQVSDKHCNFLINTGNATSQDLEALGESVRTKVREISGLELEWEIERLGKK